MCHSSLFFFFHDILQLNVNPNRGKTTSLKHPQRIGDSQGQIVWMSMLSGAKSMLWNPCSLMVTVRSDGWGSCWWFPFTSCSGVPTATIALCLWSIGRCRPSLASNAKLKTKAWDIWPRPNTFETSNNYFSKLLRQVLEGFNHVPPFWQSSAHTLNLLRCSV